MKLARTLSTLSALLFVVVVIGFFYWNSLTLQSAQLSNGAAFEPAKCWFANTSAIKAECGYMTTRHKADKPSFKLPVVVIRDSLWRNSESPMLHISGGPGGAAYIDEETMPYWLENFQVQNWGVDFVLYDQRGTGLSQPFIDCPDSNKTRLESLRLPLTASEDSEHFTQQMNQCYQYLAGSSLSEHLRLISTQHSAEDIADFHELLDVQQFILMGVSYGTRLALEFVKRFPEKVHSMVLDSVYPPEFDGFEAMVENGFKGIDKLLKACEKEVTCDSQFPGFSKQFKQALYQLVESPMKLVISRKASELSEKEILLTAHRLVLLLDFASYNSTLLPVVPAAIAAVLRDDREDDSLLKLASNYLDIELFDQFSEPVYMITECKENGRFKMAPLLERLLPYRAAYPMLDWSPQGIFDPSVCEDWLEDVNDTSVAYRQSVTSDKPTLILSGGLDSITPPEWGRQLSKSLPNSRYIEYPNAGHSVLTSSLCSNDEVQVFLNPKAANTAFCNTKQRSQALSGEKMNWKASAN